MRNDEWDCLPLCDMVWCVTLLLTTNTTPWYVASYPLLLLECSPCDVALLLCLLVPSTIRKKQNLDVWDYTFCLVKNLRKWQLWRITREMRNVSCWIDVLANVLLAICLLGECTIAGQRGPVYVVPSLSAHINVICCGWLECRSLIRSIGSTLKVHVVCMQQIIQLKFWCRLYGSKIASTTGPDKLMLVTWTLVEIHISPDLGITLFN